MTGGSVLNSAERSKEPTRENYSADEFETEPYRLSIYLYL